MITVFPKDMAKDQIKQLGCRDCRFFVRSRWACRCGFCKCIVEDPEQKVEKCPCSGCPYGKVEPCHGVCMKKLLDEWREERKGVSVYA